MVLAIGGREPATPPVEDEIGDDGLVTGQNIDSAGMLWVAGEALRIVSTSIK